MPKQTKCRDCKYLEAYGARNGGIRLRFICKHPNQQYMYEYCRDHRLTKMPGFVCFGGGLYGDEPTIKTAPAFCPLKKKKEAKP